MSGFHNNQVEEEAPMVTVTDQEKCFREVIERSWSDRSFRERLKANPKTVLGEMGIQPPHNVEIQIVENTEDKIYLTLPLSPVSNTREDEVEEFLGGDSPYELSSIHPCCPLTKTTGIKPNC